MFERYTELARRSIFMARYEASQTGSQHIETEHLLLGIFHASGPLALRLLGNRMKLEEIRTRVIQKLPRMEKISTSVDLPLASEAKRSLDYAAQESKRLKQSHIAPEHLLLGLLRDEQWFVSTVLRENGVTFARIEEEAIRSTAAPPPVRSTAVPKYSVDLTAAAENSTLGPLVGRVQELERTMQILLRRTRNNAVLIGESGVGKNSIVHGLAQSIADGLVHEDLAGRRVLAVDAEALPEIEMELIEGGAILYIRGLFDLAVKRPKRAAELVQLLLVHLAAGRTQCVATGSPIGLRLTLERLPMLVPHFEIVPVLTPSEEDAVAILTAVKQQFEKFHDVSITDDAVKTAVAASRRFLRHRSLPDRAVDLIDEAGARSKVRRETEPREIVNRQKVIRNLVRQMESAIANHDFIKARQISDEERRERLELEVDRKKLGERPAPNNAITSDDIIETVAERTGISPAAVRAALLVTEVDRWDAAKQELAGPIPLASREWVESLTAYLAGCSAEEAERLAQSIRAAKAKLNEPD
jgi:ATP-dependent Clp protease ATP-binding subunit ClpC